MSLAVWAQVHSAPFEPKHFSGMDRQKRFLTFQQYVQMALSRLRLTMAEIEAAWKDALDSPNVIKDTDDMGRTRILMDVF